jgi:hypothetical protein
MRIKHYILSIVSIISSCNFINNVSEKSQVKDSNTEEVIDPRITKSTIVTFVPYPKAAVIFPGNLVLLDKSFKQVGELKTDSIIEVEITAKSTEKHAIYPTNDSVCNKSNYLKIIYDSKEYIVYGREVYEILENEKVKVAFLNDNYQIFPVSSFQLKVFEEGFGLTGCTNNCYNIPVIKRISDKHFSLIKDQGERTPGPDVKLNYAVLLQTMGMEEHISDASVKSDTIVLSIKTSSQIANGSYNLKILYNEKLSPSIMTDVTEKFIGY